MKEQSIIKKILIQAGITILMIIPLVAGFFYLRFLISRTSSNIIEARQQFSRKSASLNAFVKLRFEYKDFGEKYLNILHNIIPQKDELINISTKLQRIAATNNLEFGFSYTGEKDATDRDLGYISFALRIKGGNMDQIDQFMKDLNKFQYLNIIETLSIKNKQSDKNSKEGIEASLAGKIYFMKSDYEQF